MTELVDLEDLNRLRFPRSPRSPKTLQRLARIGELPGARMLGGRWMVDLDKFDAEFSKEQSKLAALLPTDEQMRARVRALLEEARKIARSAK